MLPPLPPILRKPVTIPTMALHPAAKATPRTGRNPTPRRPPSQRGGGGVGGVGVSSIHSTHQSVIQAPSNPGYLPRLPTMVGILKIFARSPPGLTLDLPSAAVPETRMVGGPEDISGPRRWPTKQSEPAHFSTRRLIDTMPLCSGSNQPKTTSDKAFYHQCSVCTQKFSYTVGGNIPPHPRRSTR